MCYLWIPMCLLYEFGIWLCVFSPNKKRDLDDLDVPESDELIEV
jgi:Sec-independent protein secretion pathway component TatC